MGVRGQNIKFLEQEGLFLIANYEEMYEEARKNPINRNLRTSKIPQDILLVQCKLSDSMSIRDVLDSCNLAHLIYSQAARWSQQNLDSMFSNAVYQTFNYQGITGSAMNPFSGKLTVGKILKGKLFFDISKNDVKFSSHDNTHYKLKIIFEGLEKVLDYIDNPHDLGFLRKIELK
jgi:hypothetical protein